MDISLNYLVDYEPSVRLENVSDVLAFFFALADKNEIDYSIDIHKPEAGGGDLGEWYVSVTFDGNSSGAVCNSSICLALEKLKDKQEAMREYRIDYETLEAW